MARLHGEAGVADPNLTHWTLPAAEVLEQQVPPTHGPAVSPSGLPKEGLESAYLEKALPLQYSEFENPTPTQVREGEEGQAGCHGDRLLGMSCAGWAGFLPRGSSGHRGHQNWRGEGTGLESSQLLCCGTFWKVQHPVRVGSPRRARGWLILCFHHSLTLIPWPQG